MLSHVRAFGEDDDQLKNHAFSSELTFQVGGSNEGCGFLEKETSPCVGIGKSDSYFFKD
jgi:hypothetical protein